jgi:hypothetical protein
MGRSTKNESDTSGETLADAPTVESVEDTVEAAGVTSTPEAKAKRTRVFRGQACEILKTTKNIHTGAVYDLVAYVRTVTNRHTGEVKEVIVGRKLRRAGTGVVALEKELVLEE